MPLKFNDKTGDQRYFLDESQIDRGVIATPYDAPVRALLSEIQEKALVVNPTFQRHSVWSRTKQSRLIESLLLNIPIPVLYFAEDDDGTRVVVDGQQRLRAIEEFHTGKLRLSNLQVLPSLNSLRWTDLSPKHARIILQRTMRCVIISASSPQTLRFEMFERLNTGGVTLNDQELRNCVLHGKLNNLLRDFATDRRWQSALGLHAPDNRMDDMELALRFFAMSANVTTYRPPLKEMLTNYLRSHRNPTDEELAELTDTLFGTLAKVERVFGDHKFRRIQFIGGQPEERQAIAERPIIWDRNINRAVFDIQMVSFESLPLEILDERQEAIRLEFERLCSYDRAFWESLSLATANRLSVLTRFWTWGEALRGLGLEPAYLAALPEPHE
jgi:Protein of unknown function DUF262